MSDTKVNKLSDNEEIANDETSSSKKLTHKEKKKLKKKQEYEKQMESLTKKGGQGHSTLDSNFTVSQVTFFCYSVIIVFKYIMFQVCVEYSFIHFGYKYIYSRVFELCGKKYSYTHVESIIVRTQYHFECIYLYSN